MFDFEELAQWDEGLEALENQSPDTDTTEDDE